MHIKTILAATLSTAAILVTAAILLIGCNTNKKLNKEKETFRERQQLNEELTFAESRQVNIESHDFSKGQVTDDIVLEIQPVGPFRYSLSGGFEGEAAKVLVHGTRQHNYEEFFEMEKHTQEDLNLLVKKEGEYERYLQRKTKDKVVQRSTTSLMILMIVLVGLSWLLFRK